jgi:hypothetical protein
MARNDEGTAPDHRHLSPTDALAILRTLAGSDDRLAAHIAGVATARLRQPRCVAVGHHLIQVALSGI